jgi:chemotaxis protein MotB
MTLAKSFKENKNQQIAVEGHTDDVPLGAGLRTNFPSNWELSAARAAAVVRFLQKEGGLEPQRLSVRGYSYYKPIASNDNEEGRRQNRRIEIILKPQQ